MENKKRNVLLIIGILVFLLVVSGATYAFFTAQGGLTDSDEVNVTSSTTDSLMFNVGLPIDLVVRPNDFVQDGINKLGKTSATAKLKANNATNEATEHYYLYLDIKNNEFKYVTASKDAELVLNVTKDGMPVTIAGLTEVTVGTGERSVTGYDITEVDGLIEITSTDIKATPEAPEVTHKYEVKVTLVNLDANQNENTDKKFNAELIMQKEEKIASLASYIKKLYTTDGENGLYFHDGEGTYGEYEAGDNSYRYAGANPNNYVCFGSEEETCPEDNLYRIIGVFDDQVKLIKNKTIGQMPWDTNNLNTWSTSSLKKHLNEDYYNSLGTWANQIANTLWKVGGSLDSELMPEKNAKKFYDAEITNPKTNASDSKTEDTFKIGLMYASDYRYATDPTVDDAWSEVSMNDSNLTIPEHNWINLEMNDWIITRMANYSDWVFFLNLGGRINYSYANADYYNVRPSFQLLPKATITGGTGTETDPYFIAK